MISVRLNGNGSAPWGALALPVPATLAVSPPPELSEEIADFLTTVDFSGKAGQIEALPRPRRDPSRVILVGVADGGETAWRKAGGALARAAREAQLTIWVPDIDSAALRGLTEGLWLGEYSFRVRERKPGEEVKLREVTVLAEPTPSRVALLETARVVASHVNFARDLTNTPSVTKTPAWFVAEVTSLIDERANSHLALAVREPAQLAEEGFGGILAVGEGSAQGPRLLELSWRPPDATEHIVLVGKGITFDTGGYDIKPRDGMQLMRKDMGGAATVVAAALAAAQLELPVRITALAPLAENMVSGSAWRPGDVVRHYGGLTTEVQSTDAEGRVVLADAMAYAVAQLEPDLLVDFATLTGSARVALGKTTAALFSENDELAKSLEEAAGQSGEAMWRMPLADEYLKETVADLADLKNSPGQPGAIMAALYLREFAGALRDRWAHVDMSAPAWSSENDADIRKGATGWGVRTMVRWLAQRAGT